MTNAISEDIEIIVNEFMLRFDNYVSWKTVNNTKLKTIGEVTIQHKKFRTFTDSTDILIEINEDITDEYNQMSVEDRNLLVKRIEMLLTPIEYDPEKDTLKLKSPDFKHHTGFLEKYGYEETIMIIEREEQIIRKINDKD